MLGIIGGSGLDRMPGLTIEREEHVDTPFGAPSSPLAFAEREGDRFIFLPRHGGDHHIPPHKINYRANIWALRECGVERVVGVAAVGGITERMAPGVIAIPDQVIDYTYGREHTFYDGHFWPVDHIEFGNPYCEDLRRQLKEAAELAGVEVLMEGCYGATQGPRLETVAEVMKMLRDGADLVGMTGMPEAALAKEAGLCYASCAVVANWAAGIGDQPITMEQIDEQLEVSMEAVCNILMRMNRDYNES
jgi:5'-methylthioinosine phosphorylase